MKPNINTALFSRYESAIRAARAELLDAKLELQREGDLVAYYAPFDVINPHARVVIVGITPGKTQMRAALDEARRQLGSGATAAAAMTAAKNAAGFVGSLRPNLISMLDHIKLNAALGLQSCAELFTNARPMLQTTSILPFPVFVEGQDYRGSPHPLKHPMLRQLVTTHFEPLVRSLPDAYFVPVGEAPADVLADLASRGVIHRDKVLDGLPHPSGANAERILYFLGKKDPQQLSSKTNAAKLDKARERLQMRVLQMHG